MEFSNYQTVDRKLPRNCGIKRPTKVVSDSDFFRIIFKSNDKFDGTGFDAFYQFENNTIDEKSVASRMPKGTQTSKGTLIHLHLVILFISLLISMNSLISINSLISMNYLI